MDDVLALRLMWVGRPPADRRWHEALAFGPFTTSEGAGHDVAERLQAAPVDVLLVEEGGDGWMRHASSVAVVLLRDAVAQADVIAWLRAGASDVFTPDDLATPSCGLRLRAAAERHRLRAAERHAFATDVHTGLPHEGQLIEHMSHLLALREREPAPMALLVLRIEGFAAASARLGAEAAAVLRRKVAVRLRAGVRASDVVASLSADSFAVLLSSIDAPADAQTVGQKLQGSLSRSFSLSGQEVVLATALGIAASNADVAQPAALLRRAVGLAASAQAVGRAAGQADRIDAAGARSAANDE